MTGSKFYWDDQDASFKSIDKINLVFFGPEILKRQYNAYIELGYGAAGDFVNVYLQNKNDAWLYFKIKKGQMGIASSVPEIYNTITLLRDADKTYRIGKDVVFQFMPADLGMKDNFVVRMEDFKERFKTQIQSNTTPNSTNVKPTQTPATPATPPQETPKPQTPKDDFNQKPKKTFSLDAPSPKTSTPATDSIISNPKK